MIIIVVIATVILIIGGIKLPLPDSEKGVRELTAEINTCEIVMRDPENIYLYKLSLTLKSPSKNQVFLYYFNNDQIAFIRSLCKTKPNISISYFAQREVFHPTLTYWLSKVPEIYNK